PEITPDCRNYGRRSGVISFASWRSILQPTGPFSGAPHLKTCPQGKNMVDRNEIGHSIPFEAGRCPLELPRPNLDRSCPTEAWTGCGAAETQRPLIFHHLVNTFL